MRFGVMFYGYQCELTQSVGIKLINLEKLILLSTYCYAMAV
ncbi:hypothetical protein MCEREM21_01104 [Burkholderiaceae bacterium]